MKQYIKRAVFVITAVGMTMAMTVTAFAGLVLSVSPFSGWEKDEIGWRWKKEDGTYLTGSYHWIDGNDDGIYEQYCFDDNGYMYADTLVPPFYSQVNADGALVYDGVVQTYRPVRAKDIDPNFEDETYNQYGINRIAMEMATQSREDNKKYTEVAETDFGDHYEVTYANGFVVSYPLYNGFPMVKVDESRTDIDKTLLLKFYYDSRIDDRMTDTREKDTLLRELGFPVANDTSQTFDSVYWYFEENGHLFLVYWYCSNKLYLCNSDAHKPYWDIYHK